MVTLAVDAMGGDHGPSVVVPAVLRTLDKLPDLTVTLFGDEALIRSYLPKSELPRLHIVHTTEKIEMDEPVAQALRFKKKSSMRLAIESVKEGQSQAAVSAGNTGALMAIARFVLKTLPGVDRPAIIYAMPTQKPPAAVYVLDLGANVDCNADELSQFARMGSAYVGALLGRAPRVALLNIGQEEIKGNAVIKQAHLLLQEIPNLQYQGFIEANAVFAHDADVVVCDGFVGNVLLKTAEGVAKMLLTALKRSLTGSWWMRLRALTVLGPLKGMKADYDPNQHNGAIILGLTHLLLKSHGNASVEAYQVALEKAYDAVQKNVTQLIRDNFDSGVA